MQRLKGALKRVAAVGTGVAMFGATLTGAMAALDLADYPGPFVVDGTYDTANAIGVGAKAAASDTLAAVDIASNLQFESKTCVSGGGSGGDVTVSGDAVEVADPSDLLEVNEPIGDVRETLTEIELDGLRGGTVTTNEGSTEYNQYLRFRETSTALAPVGVNFTENDDVNEQVGDFLVVLEGSATTDAFFEYELEFEEGLESDIESGALPDIEDEELVLLGQTYVFVDTSIDTAADDITLEMLGGAVFDTLEEGEIKTYTIDGKDYEVEVLIIEDVQPETVTLVINGEVTDQLDEGETEVLEDGVLIGISDIIANEAGEAGSGDIVEFYLGATKLELTDTDYTDSTFAQRVRVDEESIEDAFVQIKGNEIDSGASFEVLTIKYRLTADAIPGQSNIYVPPGHGVREYLDEPEGMLGDWDLRYEGLDDTGISLIKIDPSGDDEYDIEFENRQGQLYVIPLVTHENGIFKFGDDDDDLVFGEGTVIVDNNPTNDVYNIGDDDYFVLSDSDNDGFDETAYTHIVRYGGIDTANNQLTFDDLATGTREFTYEVQNATNLNDGLILGKFELVFGGTTYVGYVQNDTNMSRASANQFPLAIDQNGNGSSGVEPQGDEIRITVNGGGVLDLGVHTESDGYTTSSLVAGTNTGDIIPSEDTNLTLYTLASEFDENGAGTTSNNEAIIINIDNRTSNEIGMVSSAFTATTGAFSGFLEPDDNEDHKFGMTSYGVFFDLFDEEGSNEAETLTIEYPLRQRGARIFLSMGETSTTKTTSGDVCTVADITPRTLLDTEVSQPSSYNLMIVGGPCANDLVAQIPGFPTCDEYRNMYKDGEAVIQLAENGDRVALLVAGYSAIDTRKAGKVLANWEDYELSGDMVKVTGTLGSPSVSLG